MRLALYRGDFKVKGVHPNQAFSLTTERKRWSAAVQNLGFCTNPFIHHRVHGSSARFIP